MLYFVLTSTKEVEKRKGKLPPQYVGDPLRSMADKVTWGRKVKRPGIFPGQADCRNF